MRLTVALCLVACALVVPAGASASQDEVLPGTTTFESVEVDGVQRDALVYVPSSAPTATPLPVILIFHGRGFDMLHTVHALGFRQEAERAGFIAVVPNGSSSLLPNGARSCCGWNDGRPTWGDQQPPDDVTFVSRLLDLLVEKYPVDAKRIAAAGVSNGAFMSYRLACEMSDRVSAVAAIAGTRDNAACPSMRHVSVLSIHGTADPLSPYAGGPDSRNLFVPAVVDTTRFWQQSNGCPSGAEIRMLSSVVEVRAYGPCRGGTAVQQVTINGGMHCWPGVELDAPYCLSGGPHMALDATALLVQFFMTHTRQDSP
jgi:polyhydroxybutyrate depolymerase